MDRMDDRTENAPDDIEAEIERIGTLPAAERAAALEALEARLRSTLDEIPSA
jgi:hypothetical protein